ncbi:hypothetical protein DKT75_07490 [Leucothrix arctica]|uniref:Uncharacterized protein n=1 Tax=Leucothrix arctica TaxID=1481894 RepID=A0A317CLJ0_9GAMM|nr:hypothetical protein DKT75_07490 [Leucothrix arctica]
MEIPLKRETQHGGLIVITLIKTFETKRVYLFENERLGFTDRAISREPPNLYTLNLSDNKVSSRVSVLSPVMIEF